MATAEAVRGGVNRCQVEILLPEFWDPVSGPIFPNSGDQERFWKMTRRFIEGIVECSKLQNVRAIYPDSGVAAMLSYQWPDRTFQIGSLNDRRAVAAEDELIIFACPDPPGADDCRRIVRQIGEQDEKLGVGERPVVLFNQRLSSADVGLGLNTRRMRQQFLGSFMVTYSLRPIGEIGSVFRRYPGKWKVFVEEPELRGRYKLVTERPSRPAGEELDFIISQATSSGGGVDGSGKPEEAGFGRQLQLTFTSLQKFMRSLTN